jgi:rhamnose utilization protein RhaD (predicted bifunctional aldolase and dehydrogenase)
VGERAEALAAVLELSHALGQPGRLLAILGEGNASVRLDADTFLVKASGATLETLDASGIVECRNRRLLGLLGRDGAPDAEVHQALLDARVDPHASKPSVESLFHAWLLTLPGVQLVAHAHPPAATAVLCSPRAREFAERRLFPDEIVCCDAESVLVPYTDPGLRLAQAIRDRTADFVARRQRPPRVILLESHGVVTLGRTAASALAAMLMTEKAATVWLGAAALGGPVFMSAHDVDRIASRPDEAARQRLLDRPAPPVATAGAGEQDATP